MDLAAIGRMVLRRTGTQSDDWGTDGQDLVDELNSTNEYYLAMVRGRSDNFYPTAWDTTDLSTGTDTPVFDSDFHQLIPLRIIYRYNSDSKEQSVAGLLRELTDLEEDFKRFYGSRLYKIFTVTLASPGVFTRKQHGLISGDRVIFSTTGALLTGLTAATWYYVVSNGLGDDTFEISVTKDGTPINTSGSQSGTHYFAADKPEGFMRRRVMDSCR